VLLSEYDYSVPSGGEPDYTPLNTVRWQGNYWFHDASKEATDTYFTRIGYNLSLTQYSCPVDESCPPVGSGNSRTEFFSAPSSVANAQMPDPRVRRGAMRTGTVQPARSNVCTGAGMGWHVKEEDRMSRSNE